ncbi:MAG: HAD family hydrolase [Actinobacteria bacterium]|nr:HAD family hydrolase [Actinomycetota bacterium]
MIQRLFAGTSAGYRSDVPANLPRPPKAVLFDRDGTLVVDVPFNGDPQLVEPMPGAAEALARLRHEGIRVGVISNQSGVGLGLISHQQLAAVNARVQALLGPFNVVLSCPHRPEDGCACRKPAPGMVLDACRLLGVMPRTALVVGDIGTDMAAAAEAGAQAVLVPTSVTRPEEVASAPRVARTLAEVVDLVCGARSGTPEAAS